MIGPDISHYKITAKLGEGGMGVVYKATDTKLERTVALKFLARHMLSNDEAKKRFVREAKAAAALDHPNICTVHEIDEADGETFIAMAFLEGRTLADAIAAGPLKLADVIDITTQTAKGLREAHGKGIFHRDIKPSNMVLIEKGAKERLVKIMDFGLAHLTDRSKLTEDNTTLGTPAYMSPEQAQGIPVDRRTDIWALGVVLYEMIVGEMPFPGEYPQAILYSILHEEYEPLTARRAGGAARVGMDRREVSREGGRGSLPGYGIGLGRFGELEEEAGIGEVDDCAAGEEGGGREGRTGSRAGRYWRAGRCWGAGRCRGGRRRGYARGRGERRSLWRASLGALGCS